LERLNYEQKSTEAPASVTVITSDEIKRYGYRTLADICKAPGFYVSYDRNYSFQDRAESIWGDFNSRILLLVNGASPQNILPTAQPSERISFLMWI